MAAGRRGTEKAKNESIFLRKGRERGCLKQGDSKKHGHRGGLDREGQRSDNRNAEEERGKMSH